MSKKIKYTILLLLISNLIFAQKNFTLIIDPGHGGKDPGAVGNILKEKDATLDIALKFGKLVEQDRKSVV